MFLRADSFWTECHQKNPPQKTLKSFLYCFLYVSSYRAFSLLTEITNQAPMPTPVQSEGCQNFSNPDIFYLFVQIKISLPKEENKLKLGSVWYFLKIIFDGSIHKEKLQHGCSHSRFHTHICHPNGFPENVFHAHFILLETIIPPLTHPSKFLFKVVILQLDLSKYSL